jgi:hypothetical protein
MPPAPKHPSVRQRRNRVTTATSVDAARAVKPELPFTANPMTIIWWNTIWSSPISEEWVDADVPGLLALGQLVDDFWTVDRVERTKAHAEVRMASREFGLSPFSRRQLQWEVRRVEAASSPKEQPRPTRRGKTVLAALQGGKTA